VNGGATSMEPLCMFRDRFYAGLGRRAVLARRREGERRFSLSTSVVTTTLLGKVRLTKLQSVGKATDLPCRRGRRLLLPMTDKPWFDQETGTLMLDEYVAEMDSYRRVVEDEVITDDELVEQTQRVTSLLRQLEETLSPEAKAIATEALGELTVLNALQVKRLQAASMLPQ
jgi:hypothetical protein